MLCVRVWYQISDTFSERTLMSAGTGVTRLTEGTLASDALNPGGMDDDADDASGKYCETGHILPVDGGRTLSTDAS